MHPAIGAADRECFTSVGDAHWLVVDAEPDITSNRPFALLQGVTDETNGARHDAKASNDAPGMSGCPASYRDVPWAGPQHLFAASLPFDVIHRVLYGNDRLRHAIRNHDIEHVLEFHDQFDLFETINVQVIDQRCRQRHLPWIHAKVVHND
jgi:hypothetical protein